MDTEKAKKVLSYVDPERVVKLEQTLVRIPSLTFEEGPISDKIAEYLDEVGIEVNMVEVVDPFGSGKRSRQPLGIIRGDGTGPSLMLNGHIDHNPLAGARERWDRDPYSGDSDGTYVYGRGSIDEKGGVVGLLTAGEAIKKGGFKLKGDLILCPVMGHKSGAIGTLHHLKEGLRADMCINTETTDLGIITVGVGVVRVHVTLNGRPVHFSSPAEMKANSAFPIYQMARFIDKLGPDVHPIAPGGWLTFTPETDLPGFPQLSTDDIQSKKVLENRCELSFQIRLVPGQNADSVRNDLERLVAELGKEIPNMDVKLEVPPNGGWNFPPYKIPKDHLLATTLAHWHEIVSGKPAIVGSGPRLGACGDANFLANAGIPTVQYGPGGIAAYEEWPAINERIAIEDLLIGARTLTLAAAEICGA